MSATRGEVEDGQHDGEGAKGGVFDGARYIVRARRLADLSQRELAEAVGLSRATVGRLESGAARVDAATLSVILEQAQLRLAVVDRDGREVDPIPSDVLRDHAGRRFPGHLDARPPVDAPADRVDSRRGGPPARGWYYQRSARAYRRGRLGVPVDHPTTSGLRKGRQDARRQALAAARARQLGAVPGRLLRARLPGGLSVSVRARPARRPSPAQGAGRGVGTGPTGRQPRPCAHGRGCCC